MLQELDLLAVHEAVREAVHRGLPHARAATREHPEGVRVHGGIDQSRYLVLLLGITSTKILQ